MASAASGQAQEGQGQQDQRLSGAVTATAPRVAFDLQLAQGQIVTLTTSSSENFDTVLALNGPGGRRVAENDDQEPGVLSSRIVYVASSAGRYTAIVSGYGGATGAFELNIAHGLDVGLSDSARALREETLTFDQRRTERRFPVDLAADDILVATTFATTPGLDTTLTLVDRGGHILAQSDDMGDGSLNSRIVYQAAAAGRYEIIASTFDRAGAGSALLSLAIDPEAEAPFNFASIQGVRIATYEGEITDAQPSLDYPVELAAGQTLLALADATSGDLDTVLRLNDAEDFPVALNDDRGDGSLNSGFAYTAPAAGVYTLQLYRFAQSNSSGAFRLTLSSVDAAVVDTLQALVEDPVVLSGPEQVIETADFRVYFTTEGRDASTPAYARSVADTLQEVLQTQVSRIGWAPPVRDADGRFRAYVADAEGQMGFVKPVQIVFDNPNTSAVREHAAARTVLVIDNDFLNMGKEAPPESLMRATVTHEFNHVVQFGYDSQEGLNWLYEATASWTETTTVGRDQDATDYVATDFAAPELCWTTLARGHNYAQWTLLQSLADSYGERFVVRLWENSVAFDGFETMARTLDERGANIPDTIRRWRVQNFARAYDLAPLFARSVRRAGVIDRIGRWTPDVAIEQLGASYIETRLRGPRIYSLLGDESLELVGLGLRNGRIEAVPLGRAGVFDTTGLEYAALMVFNRSAPTTPGACAGASYAISVTVSAQPPAAAQFDFSAAHFAPLEE